MSEQDGARETPRQPTGADGLVTAFLAGLPAERRQELRALVRAGMAKQRARSLGEAWDDDEDEDDDWEPIEARYADVDDELEGGAGGTSGGRRGDERGTRGSGRWVAPPASEADRGRYAGYLELLAGLGALGRETLAAARAATPAPVTVRSLDELTATEETGA